VVSPPKRASIRGSEVSARADQQSEAAAKRHEFVGFFGGLSWTELIRRVWCSSNDDDIYNRGYELAYNFLIAVFPFLLFLMALFGLSVSEGAKLRYDLFRYFQEILPPLAYDLLQQTVTEVIQRSNGGKLTFGLLLALYAGSSGTTQLMSTLNFAYRVRETRSWIKVRLISLALTLVISLLIIIASLMVLAGGFVAEFLGREIGLSSIIVAGWKALQDLMSIGFVLLACALVYYFAPDLKRRRWHWVTPGSVIGVALWLVASGALRLYLHYITSYSKSYGTVGAVIILLLWFYVTGLAFLIGAEVNAVTEHALDQQQAKRQQTDAA
jgi:membrane protein